MRLTSILILIFICLTTLEGCAVNPVTGKTELALISGSDEISMGTQQYLPSQQSQGGQYRVDKNLTAYVSEVGRKVASVSERPLPYEFVVLNNSVPNAWALPGGKIAINRGLLLALENEAELAAVLAHEVVHAAARHGANAMQRGMVLQGLVMATSLSSADSEYANYIVGGAQLGAQLITTKYGRSAELESDLYGIKYMTAAGYDPAAAITLQETFVRLSEARESSWLDGLFASHPPSEERVSTNRQTVAELGSPAGELGRQTYQEKIAFLKQTKPAYDVFDRAQSLAQSGNQIEALKFVTSAIDKVPGEARFLGLQGNLFYQAGDLDRARAAFNKALTFDPNYFEYHLGLGLIASKQGNKTLARQSLQRSNELLPTAIANHELGQLTLAAGDRNLAKEYFGNAMGAKGNIGKAAETAFLSLDITDNPQKYVATRARLSDGYLVIDAQNRTNLSLSGVQISVNATINGQAVNREISVPLGPEASISVSSGWALSSADVISEVQVEVRQISL